MSCAPIETLPIRDLNNDDPNFGRPIFRATIPRERFKNIYRFLRFDDFTTRVERASVDKLAPIRCIWDSLNSAFHYAYHPGKLITIDEHLCRYRGRCKFIQYMSNKPDNYGLRCWVIADSRNYYPIPVEVNTGRNMSLSNSPEDVTMRLASKLSPGHVIVGDNYFTSLKLSNRLLKEKNNRKNHNSDEAAIPSLPTNPCNEPTDESAIPSLLTNPCK